jgi:predicted ATPase
MVALRAPFGPSATRFRENTMEASLCRSQYLGLRRHPPRLAMLERLTVRGFKSLADVQIDLPRLTVLFGSNAAGKSNLLDAMQALSRVGTMRTLADALAEPIRGYPIESFTFPRGGLAELYAGAGAQFELGADLRRDGQSLRYRVAVAINPSSGTLSVADEFLALLDRQGDAKGHPAIQQIDGRLRVRRKTGSGKPTYEPLNLNYTIVSDPRRSAPPYATIESARNELADWRTYYLDPRTAMRLAQPPSDVRDIGVLGGDIAPFLYRLRAEYPKHFLAVVRTLRSVIPAVESLDVDLDKRRGTLEILLRQDGVDYSSRIASEGTLRVLALCCIAVNPWGGTLLAFEEPENGVHPRRIELIARLLQSLALDPLAVKQGRQVVVTTHSPLFCDAILRGTHDKSADVRIYSVRRENMATAVAPLDLGASLFRNTEIKDALTNGSEDGLFENLIMRGLIE